MQLEDYIRRPESLHLLFQLQQGPKSLGYLVERSGSDRTTIKKRLRQAKERGLIGERAGADDGRTYELDKRGRTIVDRLQDDDAFDKKGYLDRRREINDLRQQIDALTDEMDGLIDAAAEAVDDTESSEDDAVTFRIDGS